MYKPQSEIQNTKTDLKCVILPELSKQNFNFLNNIF